MANTMNTIEVDPAMVCMFAISALDTLLTLVADGS
jgi:hypothetical protein